MKKTTKLAEYKNGYDLITDGEFNGLFVAHIKDLKNLIITKQQHGGTHYLIYSRDFNDKKVKLYHDFFAIESTNVNTASSTETARKFAEQFAQKYPTRTVVISIYCLTANFNPDGNEQFSGMLLSGQTADGRCCMAWYKIIFDKNGKMIDFNTIDEHIPKKHTNDEEYIWEGNENLLKIINKLTNKKS